MMNMWTVGITYLILGSPLHIIPYLKGNLHPHSKKIYQALWDVGWIILALAVIRRLHRLPEWLDYLVPCVIFYAGWVMLRTLKEFIESVEQTESKGDKE